MEKKRRQYTSPISETVEVKMQKVICLSDVDASSLTPKFDPNGGGWIDQSWIIE
jgi:hypothetical protein